MCSDPAIPATADTGFRIEAEQLATELARHGRIVVDHFLSPAQMYTLAAEARVLWRDGAYHPAAVGRGQQRQVRQSVRRDHVLWLDPTLASPAQQVYLTRMDTLRGAVNRHLLLGLFDFEAHFALYPPGSFYRRHLDRHQGSESRLLTTTLYLNSDWNEEDGGALRLYLPPGKGTETEGHVDITPLGGRLVCFLSGEFEHEVLPTRRERLSLTGWFRARASLPLA